MLGRLLGSQVRAALFRALFSEGRREVYLRELSRLTGFSAPSLLREANQLLEESIICVDKRENRSYYSANVESPLYDIICSLVERTSSGEAILKSVFKDSAQRVAFIYGSRANGTARPDSDYDLMLIGEEGLRATIARLSAVKDRLGVEINPYVLTPSEFSRRLSAGDHFLTEVRKSPKVFLKGSEDELKSMEG